MSIRRTKMPAVIAAERARCIWLHAQRLSRRNPFGKGPGAVCAAVEQLGYIQIDTINVIERCHHHILSPFDPLIIQRKRTEQIFDYAHLFEAYVPKAKRKLGYFTLPVLADNEIVAALDLKTDRQANKMLIQSWHWVGKGNATDHKQRIEEALHKFEQFQLSRKPA